MENEGRGLEKLYYKRCRLLMSTRRPSYETSGRGEGRRRRRAEWKSVDRDVVVVGGGDKGGGS